MEKKVASKIPLWKLMVAIQAMLDEGYDLVDITVEDNLTVAMKPRKKEEEDLPNINQLTL